MKRLLLLLAITSQISYGQDADAPAENDAPKKQFILDINNLTQEKRQEYYGYYLEAERLFTQKRVFECLSTIEKAHKIYAKNPATLNLEGACYVEFRNFEKAKNAFADAKSFDPTNSNVKFNLAEIDFVTHDWSSALDKFESLQALGEEAGFHQSMRDLIDFKVTLCQFKTGKTEEATETISNLSYKDDTPLYYYGNAALSYSKDKTTEAEEWLARGRRVFQNPTMLAPWQDTLIEFGYIKSFYGGDLEAE